MEFTTFFGIAATTGSLLVASLGIFSQIRANYKNKTCGINSLYAILIFISYALWVFYGVVKKDFYIFIPHLVGMCLAAVVLYQLKTYKRIAK